MSNTQIRISKSMIAGTLCSLVVFIIAGWLVLRVMEHIPSTALAQTEQFLRLHANDSNALSSPFYQSHAARAGREDAYIATPLSMLIAGVVLGLFARRSRLSSLQMLTTSLIIGFVIAIGTVVMDWVLTRLVQQMLGQQPVEFNLSKVPLDSAMLAIGSVVLSAAAYAVGALLVSRKGSLAAAPKVPVTSAKTA